MFFILTALFVLFTLLAIYASMKTLWLFAVLFIVLAVATLVVMINRYRRTKKGKSKDDNDHSWWDCFYYGDCPDCSTSNRKGDCDCGDLDCAPDCSL